MRCIFDVGRDVYRTTPAVARGLGFYSLIRKTAPDTRLFITSMEHGGLILTRIPTALIIKSALLFGNHTMTEVEMYYEIFID